jgi:predicted nuclease with RNAse H fold
MPITKTLIGIDFGSKLAGTTVIAILEHEKLHFLKSEKDKDADAFIKEVLSKYHPTLIGIDAPLSLPGVYCKLDNCNDYFYREADKGLKAMSPMFLGGLTARAIKLKASLAVHTFYEVYPAALSRVFDLQSLDYKKEKSQIILVAQKLLNEISLNTHHVFTTWHEVDALLALCSVIRIYKSEAISFGNKDECEIWV